jgi:hypothetical protein
MQPDTMYELVLTFILPQVETVTLQASVDRKESAICALESEIQQLNDKVHALKHKIGSDEGKMTGSDSKQTGRDDTSTFGTASAMTGVMDIQNTLQDTQARLQESEETRAVLQSKYNQLNSEVAVMRATFDKANGSDKYGAIMAQVQSIWEEVGIDAEKQEKDCFEVENCLDIACQTKLDEASALKKQAEEEIARLVNELDKMQSDLGMQTFSTQEPCKTILGRLTSLQHTMDGVRAKHSNALDRREKLIAETSGLLESIGMHKYQLPKSLQQLLGDDHKSSSGYLSEEYLVQCDTELKKLKMQKASIFASNTQILQRAHDLAAKLNMSKSDILDLVSKQTRDLRTNDNNNNCITSTTDIATTQGWSSAELSAVTASVLSKHAAVKTTGSYTLMLNQIFKVVEETAERHRFLADKLSDAINRAQTSLLSIVDGEIRTAEYIESCIQELKTLTPGVQAMTQSEIEALTVVWEALDVESTERASFWSKIEEGIAMRQFLFRGPFEQYLATLKHCNETWLQRATNEAATWIEMFDAHLYKLEQIHGEVERLRSRQDIKSKIISLDSEVRILNAKLTTFEENNCQKQRLLTKKVGSATLLKEERFRKQMQSKFTSKLELLAKLLTAWVKDEGSSFDPELLSQEVRMLLENSEHMEQWVKVRTGFMHLSLLPTKSAKKPRLHQAQAQAQAQTQPLYQSQLQLQSQVRRSKSPPTPSHSVLPAQPQTQQPTDTHTDTIHAPITRQQTRATISAPTRQKRKLDETSISHDQAQSKVPRTASKQQQYQQSKSTSTAKPSETLPSTRASTRSMTTRSSRKISPLSNCINSSVNIDSTGSSKSTRSAPSPLKAVNKSARASTMVTSATAAATKDSKRLTLPPFGKVLEQSLSPSADQDKENASTSIC